MDNKEQLKYGKKALKRYAKSLGDDSRSRSQKQLLTDLLTDLMHVADESDPELFDECLKWARIHFKAESD